MQRSADVLLPIPFGRYLLGAGGLLVLLFAVLEPSPSAGLGFIGRLVFWALHVYGALALLAVAQSWLVQRAVLLRRPWLLSVLSGFVGGVLFAPLALALDRLFELPEDFDDKGIQSLEGFGLLGEILKEASELIPAVATVWIVLQLPWLLRLELRSEVSQPEDEPPPQSEASSEDLVEPAVEETSPPTEATSDSGLFAVLPEALGRDVAAMTSELHYLRVRTPRGAALVLYNLKDAVSELEGSIAGLKVHRSHWVARDHVRRLVRRGSGWACELSTGDEIPISRRQTRQAREAFGDAAEYQLESSV